MTDLLALSARYIDENVYEGPGWINRINGELSEVAPGIAMVEAFSHVIALETGEGLVLFDTSLENFGPAVLKALRGWRDTAIHTIAYTHGHIDHVGGTAALLEEARERGRPAPRVVSHENVPPRFARYERTNGYNAIINARQFSRSPGVKGEGGMSGLRFGPKQWVQPDVTFGDRLQLRVGELVLELHHTLGETDDHLWAWIPERRAICSGDLMCWIVPNAGNPQKVQRYPHEWSVALREMAALEPELLLPAHGLPIAGRERIRGVLDDVAGALESLVEQTLALMNQGAPLDTVIHDVKLADELLEKPYLRPVYDEPEFIVRNIWRLYGGWYDGNPAHLKPAPERSLALEVTELAGGAEALAKRARFCADAGDLRLACQLIEWAVQAEPESRAAHAARAEIYDARRQQELSLMSKGVFGAAAADSRGRAEGSA